MAEDLKVGDLVAAPCWGGGRQRIKKLELNGGIRYAYFEAGGSWKAEALVKVSASPENDLRAELSAERRRFDFLASMEGMSLAWFCSVHGTAVADGAKDEDADAWRAAIDRILGGAR